MCTSCGGLFRFLLYSSVRQDCKGILRMRKADKDIQPPPVGWRHHSNGSSATHSKGKFKQVAAAKRSVLNECSSIARPPPSIHLIRLFTRKILLYVHFSRTSRDSHHALLQSRADCISEGGMPHGQKTAFAPQSAGENACGRSAPHEPHRRAWLVDRRAVGGRGGRTRAGR